MPEWSGLGVAQIGVVGRGGGALMRDDDGVVGERGASGDDAPDEVLPTILLGTGSSSTEKVSHCGSLLVAAT